MNKHLYRIIFSKTQQRLVVVSDIATGEGKAKSEGQQGFTLLNKHPHWQLKPIALSLLSVCGYLFLSAAQANELQIRADNTAPKSQQPIVLQTANGLPQVNIQTPNDKGLSHNKYQQFDVAPKGAILNNSRKKVQTTQAGWVQANPYLVGGEAKVILNEVNASKPSQLKGYIEVAGNKADVIIANPSGIHCEGCGVINAGRSTFTTGEVQLENGQVKGYRVKKGTVSVAGRGLDSSRQDYTDIIAKEVKVNAGIWANELKVTTGQNQVSANNDSIQVIRAGDASQTQGYAVDVAELGGMYANNIHLIGTEHGLGVRNAGHIGAAAGEVKVSSEGQLVNTGYIGAKQEISLQSLQQTENQANGILYSQQGDLSVTSHQAGITQQGSFIAKGKAQGKGNITLKAKETISQSGESLAEGDIRYRAKDIETHPTAKFIAGGAFTHTAQGEQVTIPSYHASGNTLKFTAEETISSHGKHLASTQITAQAKQLDFSQSGLLAYQADLTATQNHLVLDQGHFELKNTLHLATPTHLSSQQANLQANHIFATASSLDNQRGTWINRDQQLFSLHLPRGLNNEQGQMVTQGSFNIFAKGINNQKGLFFAKGNLTLDSQHILLNNQQGVINTEGQLDLQSGELINDSGLIQSVAAMNIDTHQQQLNNQATKQSSRQLGIISFDKLTLKTGELLNQNGFIANHQAQKINASHIINSKGVIQSDHTQHLMSQGAFDNTQGEIVASNDLFLDTGDLNNDNGLIATEKGRMTLQGHGQFTNWQGNLLSQGDATITVFGLDNAQQGLISSSANLTIDTHQALLRNEQGVLFAQQRLLLNSGELNNQQGLIQGQRGIIINTHQHSLNNKQTQHQGITSQGDISLHAITSLTNQQGNISANGNLDIQSEQVDNQQGNVSSQQLSLTGETLDNRQGTIQTQQNAHITAHRDINNQAVTAQGSVIQSGAALTLITNHLNNQGTKATTTTPTQGLLAHQLALNSDQLDNQQGGIYTTALLNANVTQNIQNQQGEILSLGNVNLQGDSLTLHNQHGIIESGQNLRLVLQQFNDEGNIKSHQDALIELQKDLILTQPFVVAGHLAIKTMGDFINQTQLITGKGLQITAKQIENPTNSEFTSPNTQLTANSLTNRGLIDGTQNAIYVNTLNNLGTGRIYGDELAIQANVLNNQPEHSNNEVHTATIATRNNLHLGVGTLTNSDHALILSLGDLTIGGQIDANQRAIGQADFVDNGSATIEALGNGKINTKRLWNHDLHLVTGYDVTHDYIEEYRPNGSNAFYTNKEGYLDWNNNSRHDANAYFRFKEPNKRAVGSDTWYQRFYTQTITTSKLIANDPAKILFGGHLYLSGAELVNEDSKLLIGGNLFLGNERFTSNTEHENLGQQTVLINKSFDATINRHNQGKTSTLVAERHRRKFHHVWAHYTRNEQPFAEDLPTEHFKFGLTENTIGQSDVIFNQITNKPIETQHQAGTFTIKELQVSPLSSSDYQGMSVTMPIMPNVISVQMSQNTGKVRTYQPNIHLPQVSLYRINPNTDSHILIETDPHFTQRDKWLSSDYMFDALRADPQRMLKRLGDGFYEQRLINEQINQLTGQRYLPGYTNDLEQYKALMNNGIHYAKRFDLQLGVALTPEQMSLLTNDMVWLVKQDISLPSGETVTVLVPQVYLVSHHYDVDSLGGLIAAKQITGELINRIENSGVIAGRQLINLSTTNLLNQKGGLLIGENVSLSVREHLNNLGGQIKADYLYAKAKNINIASTMGTSQAYTSYHTERDQIANLTIKHNAILSASQSAILQGVQMQIGGNAIIQSGGNLRLDTLTRQEKLNYVTDIDNYWTLDKTEHIGNQLSVQGNIYLAGVNGINMTGSEINAKGEVNLSSTRGNITLQESRTQERLSSAVKYKVKDTLSSTTTTIKHDHQYDLAQGSQLSGNNIVVTANQGKVSVKGSTIVADNNVHFQAQAIDITAAKNSRKVHDFYAEKKSGLMSSGGIGFTIGSRAQQHDYQDKEITQSDARATIGSLGGDVTFVAGEQATILGTDVIAQADKAINITSKSMTVDAGKDLIERREQHQFKQSGLTVSLSTPATDMGMKARESLARSQQVTDSRLKALYAIKAAQEGVIAAQEAKKAVETVQAGKKADFKVSIGVGSSQSASSSETTQITHQGSTLNAGQVNLTATDGDIAVLGSTIQAAEKVSLDAAKSLQLTSVQDIEHQRSQNSNSGWSAGVFAGVNGGSPGFGVEGAIQKGKGHENSNSVIQRNTTVQGQAVQLRSGEDTALKGAVVTGDKLNVEVGNNLVIESRQDSQQYDSKQIQGGVSAGVSVIGSGSYASVNGSLNRGKLNAAYVETQSGLHAGEAGLTVNVASNTHLTGAIVDSQASQEKNHFTTGSLTSENIENYSEAKVESIGGGLSTDPTQNIANGFAAGLSALGNINKQDSSTTHSAVGSNIQLTTQQGDVPTSLSRDTKAANEQVDKTEIADLKTRQEMAQVIGEIANNGITIVLKPKLDEAERQKAEAEAILKADKTNAAALEQKRLANDVIKTYGQGGQIQLAVRAVTGVLQGIATGEATQAAVGGLSPYANQAIKQLTTDSNTGEVNTQANLMAHALLGAVEAYAAGNNATAGAAGAVGGELAAKIITEQLYQKTPEQLTEAQKQTVTALSQLASGLAGGLISDSTAGAINAAEIGKRAVEDNGLLSGQVSDLFRELEAAEKDNQSIEEIFTKAKELSDKQYRELETNCSDSVICRYGTEKVLEDANQKAFELIGYFNSRLTNLSYDSQVKFIEFVIDENSKEFNFIEKNRTVAEKLVVGLVDSFIESQQAQGIKISPKIASFAKKVKNPNIQNKDWKYIPAPKQEEITGFKDLAKIKYKTPVQGGGRLRERWKDKEGNIYEWDSRHGTMEKYNKRGKHLGEFDFKTGEQLKNADPTRRIEP
ncbi:hemagglutinin repeat-containing protein [Gallibacterium anatis]|uniref:two-partner secretion domain-containing protein n=1 Tax=Gallibacterium anatis TaxID=750 RepID=UPI003AAC0C26